MTARYAIGDERDSPLVIRTAPPVSTDIPAEQRGLIDLGISPRLVLPFVPARSHEYPDLFVQLLLQVEAEAVLKRLVFRVVIDIRNRECFFLLILELVDREMVVAHVCVVGEAKQPDRAKPALNQVQIVFNFVVLGMSVLQVPLEVDAVGDRWLQGLGKTRGKIVIV